MSDERPSTDRPARAWRRHGVNEPPGLLGLGLNERQAKRRRTLLLLGIACTAVTAALIAWFLLPEGYTEPYFLTIPLTEYGYEPRLPINAWAAEDSQALRVHFPNSRGEFNFQEGHILLRALDTLRDEHRPVVVHLRALALTRGEQVYLLPGDTKFTALESYERPLEQVLQALRAGDRKNQLVLLDLMQPLADPFLGVLFDDTARKVNAYLEREFQKPDAPPGWVLCACGPGEVSLVSEELGLSVFGHYVNEGLHGKADGWRGGKGGPDRVTALELCQYVQDHVSLWARRNRGREQRPVLHGKGRDFDVVSLKRAPPARPARPEMDAYPRWLRTAWEKRDELWYQDANLLASLALQQFEAALLRAEQRWRGVSFAAHPDRLRKTQQDVREAQQRLEEQLRQAQVRQPREASLAWARRLRGEQLDQAPHKEVEDLVEQRRKADKAAEQKEREELDKGLRGARQVLLDKYKDRPALLGEALFTAAQKNPHPEVVVLLGGTAADGKLPERYAELRFLHRLAESLEVLRKKQEDRFKRLRTEPEVLQAVLHSTRQAEEAAVCDPEVLPWIQEAYAEAARLRRQGLEIFRKEGPSRWGAATALLQQAAGRFTQLARARENLEQAYKDLNKALDTLPRVLPYLLARRTPDPRALRDWGELVKGITRLDELIAARKWEESPALATAGGDVQRHYGALRLRMAESTFKGLQGQAESGDPVALLDELEAMRASPWMKASVRDETWQLQRRLARKLLEKSEEAETHGYQRAPDVAEAEPDHVRAALRARVVTDLLRVAGVPDGARLTAELEKLAGSTDLTAWAAFGEKLRRSWNELEPRWQKVADGNPEEADRVHRLLPLRAGDLAGARGNPSGLLRQQAAEDYWRWFEGIPRE